MAVFFIISLFNLAFGFVLAVHLKKYLSKVVETDEADNDDEAHLDKQADQAAPLKEPEQETPGQETIPESWTETLFAESIVSESLVEATIHVLKLTAKRHLDEFIEMTVSHSPIKTADQASEAVDVQKCMVEAGGKWVEFLDSVRSELEKHFGRFGHLTELQVLVDSSANTHSIEIKSLIEEADKVNFGKDFEASREEIGNALRTAIASLSGFADTMDATFAQLIETEERYDRVDPGLLFDPDTNLLNRCGLQKTLHEWRTNATGSASIVCFAINDFEILSYFDGIYIGDRLIQSVSRVLDSNVRKTRGFDRLARLEQGRMFLLLGDTEVGLATFPAERLRRIIREAQFNYGRSEMQIRVAASVCQLSDNEPLETTFERLIDGLEKAFASEHDGDVTLAFQQGTFNEVTPGDTPIRAQEVEIDERQADYVASGAKALV